MARAALLRASFIARADLRSLRHIARHRQKLGGMLASEKNWLHKLLTDAGIRLGVVVSDLHGQSARVMLKALIAGKTVPEVRRPCSESPNNKQDKALPADGISEVMALFVQNESNKAYLHR